MADMTSTPVSSISHPPPPGTIPSIPPAPGVESKTKSDHMPPQPPHLTIPTNFSSIPSSIMSPPSTGGYPAPSSRAAPHNNKTLYVGNLHPDVTQEQLQTIFKTLVENRGHVVSVKIIPDKNAAQRGLNYGFVELNDPSVAEFAMLSLNGRKIAGQDIKINWAYMSQKDPSKEDTSNHFHVFVGDLSQTTTDDSLFQAFAHCGDCSEARVMWDHKTNRTRGYGFVAFRTYEGANNGMKMDGQYVGDRQIRVNWANQKGQPNSNQKAAMEAMGMSMGAPMGMPAVPGLPTFNSQERQHDYQRIYDKTPASQTTIYVGNLAPHTTGEQLSPLFLRFGQIVEIRATPDRGYAFVKYKDKTSAAAAIQEMNEYVFSGRQLRVSWGKDRTGSQQTGRAGQNGPQSAGAHPPPSPFVHDAGYIGGYPPSAGPYSAMSPPAGFGYPPSASPMSATPGGYPQGYGHQHHGSIAGGYASMTGQSQNGAGYGHQQYAQSPASYNPSGYAPTAYGGQSGGPFSAGGYGQAPYSAGGYGSGSGYGHH